MRAIWSFWTKPYKTHQAARWPSEQIHLFSWILSVETARRHYPSIVLYTDDQGARLLVDALQLPFVEVTTELSRLDNFDGEWWIAGKLYTYRDQTMPFMHIDSDVFLWKALPEDVDSAPVFAQNVEHFALGNNWYRPDLLEAAIGVAGGWLPKEWTWYSRIKGCEAVCCGILGGTRTDFLSYYADRALHTIAHRHNQSAWQLLTDRIGHNILFEQYFLSACLHYHGSLDTSPYRQIRADYLFESEAAAFDGETARRAGYTHLIAGAKRNPVVVRRLEARVRCEYPQYYERALRYVRGS